jgi:SAM-dependent methyltransferase
MAENKLVSDSEFWNQKYKLNDIGWDLGGPTPFFSSWIETQKPSQHICILGAGNGYDALHFCSKGHIVSAVDFAKLPVQCMKQVAKEKDLTLNVIQEDIFNLPKSYKSSYDIVVEQTCFCAINPTRRSEYIDVVFNILKPGGKFVGFLFPINKKEDEGGPPFAVQLEKTLPLFESKFELVSKHFPDESILPRKGNEIFVEMVKLDD